MNKKTNEQKNEIEKAQTPEIQIRENCGPKPRKPRGPRLNSRQVTFFRHVFGVGLPVGNVLQDLNIRVSTFNRWLQSPRFLKELEMNFNRFYMEARIEVARSIGPAVCGLSDVNQKTLNPEAVRKAGNDLLKLQHMYSALPGASGMRLRIGSKTHRFGLLLEQFGLRITQESHDFTQPCLSNSPEKALKSAQNNPFCHPAQTQRTLLDVQEIEIAQTHPTPNYEQR